jgi:hypothetical protein
LHPRVGDDVLGLGEMLGGLDLDGIQNESVRRRVLRRFRFAASPSTHDLHLLRARLWLIDILIELHPQGMQHVRAIVGVVDCFVSFQLFRRGIELCVKLVVSFVLPIAGPRGSVARWVNIYRIGKRQGSECQPWVIRRRLSQAQNREHKSDRRPAKSTHEHSIGGFRSRLRRGNSEYTKRGQPIRYL